jgi:hypothetical protein
MMPIKSFTFAFKLDAKELLAYVVERNIAVDIHATGTKRQELEPAAIPTTQQPLALPAPHTLAGERASNGRIGSRAAILFYLAQHGRATPSQLRAALVEAGYKPHTYNNLMHVLKRDGLVSQSAQGYRILNKGLKKLDVVAEGNE